MSNKVSNIKERILYILEIKRITKDKFFPEIGMTYGSFTGKAKESPLNSIATGKILLKFPDINPEWLINGVGEIYKETENTLISNPNLLRETDSSEYSSKNKTLDKEIKHLKQIISEKDALIKAKDEIIELLKRSISKD